MHGSGELGNAKDGGGQYLLSGTGIAAMHSLVVGNKGQVEFTQSGGTLLVQKSLQFDNSTGTSGDGTLYVGLATAAAFSLKGGDIRADVLRVADNPFCLTCSPSLAEISTRRPASSGWSGSACSTSRAAFTPSTAR